MLEYSSLLECRRNSCGISHLLERIVSYFYVIFNSSSIIATNMKMSTITLLQEPKYGSTMSMTTCYSSLSFFYHQWCRCILAASKCAISLSAHTHIFKPNCPGLFFMYTVNELHPLEVAHLSSTVKLQPGEWFSLQAWENWCKMEHIASSLSFTAVLSSLLNQKVDVCVSLDITAVKKDCAESSLLVHILFKCSLFQWFCPTTIRIPINAYSSLGIMFFQFSFCMSHELQKKTFVFLFDLVQLSCIILQIWISGNLVTGFPFLTKGASDLHCIADLDQKVWLYREQWRPILFLNLLSPEVQLLQFHSWFHPLFLH